LKTSGFFDAYPTEVRLRQSVSLTLESEMAENTYLDCLVECLSFLDVDLAAEESVLRIEQGQTLYSRNTLLIYRFQIGTFANPSGNKPTNIRYRTVQVTSNSPHAAAFAKDSDWTPLIIDPVVG
jgi:hypothetical protein